MKLKYVGAHRAGVDLAMPDGSWAYVPHQGEVEVDDAHGASLLEQTENWQPVDKPKDEPKDKPAKLKDGE